MSFDCLARIEVIDEGSGYALPPTVTISGGGGSNAAAVALVLDGSVKRVFVSVPGSGYTGFPRVVIDPPPPAPIPTTLAIRMAQTPQLVLQAETGVQMLLQWTDALRFTNQWITITNVALGSNAVLLQDFGATQAEKRFYRAVPPVPATMALIPAGAFTMGNCMDPSEGGSDELPLHSVYVSAFYMDKCEVTRMQWDEVYVWATNHGYSFDNVGSGKATNHPVHTVCWYDAVKWCNARSEKEGRVPAYYTSATQTKVYRTERRDVLCDWVKWNVGYRLPTEAEWEKAARGGSSGHRFPWANVETITHSQANYYSEADYAYDISPTRDYHPSFITSNLPFTSPVGYFAPNGFGLSDMAGNVAEWCWDWYGSYAGGSESDPTGPYWGFNRMLRGGSFWFHSANLSRTACRAIMGQQFAFFEVGFRSVLPKNQ
ncbi:MAG: SUMF1/EgtB/PvdO family nonheme iron enzyme [Verrucomicrobia bacterium]|nr:SUMF1/EgtB/PvdO family nonheme iron enzyme [Verrucomicrobiota bacterium]